MTSPRPGRPAGLRRQRARLLALLLPLVAAGGRSPIADAAESEAAPASGSEEAAPDEATAPALPPLLIHWPLEPVRRQLPAPRPARASDEGDAVRAERVEVAEPAASGSAPVGEGAEPTALVARRGPSLLELAPPTPVVALEADAGGARRDGARPRREAGSAERPTRPEAEPPGPSRPPPERPRPRPGAPDPAPVTPPKGPPPEPPARVRPLPPAPRRAAERKYEVTLVPEILPAPRVAAGRPVTELTPPTPEVRRWTWPDTGELTWDALESSKEGEWVVLSGQVDVHAGPDRIQADVVRLHQGMGRLEAEGNVVLDHLDSRLTGSRMEYDLETNTGTVWNVLGYTGSDLNFTAARAEKIGVQKYAIYDGTFTSCTQPLPIWQVKATKAIIHVDHFVYTWNPRIFFKKMPAYYLPYAAFPIKQHRSTGFMIPKISSSSRRGLSISEEFFWAINRSVDLTLGGEWWDKFGWRSDVEARWHLNGMSSPGFFRGAFLSAQDEDLVGSQQVDDQRWHARFEHRQDIWEDWNLTVRGEAGSDQFLDRDGGLADLGDKTPVFNQRVSLQKRWGKHALNIFVENDEREQDQGVMKTDLDPMDPFDADAEATETRINRNLPLAEYRLSSLQLGGKRWAALSAEGSLAGLQRIVENQALLDYGDPGRVEVSLDTIDHSYMRADLHPQLRFPVGTPFLEVVPSFNVRGTWWSRRETGTDEDVTVDIPNPIDPSAPTVEQVSFTTTPGVDDGLFLWAWDAGVEVGGPDFERIYNRAALPGERKWQHVIEPEIDVRYTPGIDEEFIISGDQQRSHYSRRFDQTGLRSTFRLRNTLRNKLMGPDGKAEDSARDWLIWTLSIDYDFKEKASTRTFESGRLETSHWSDVRSDVNFRPTDDVRFSLRNTYDVLQDDVTSTSLVGGVAGDWGYMDLSFRSRRDTTSLDDRNTELSMTGEHWFYKDDRIRIGYDFTKSFNGSTANGSSWPYKRVVVSYFNQCCGVSLSWEDNDDRSVRREKEWIFLITLKDLGNYLRFKQRSSDSLGP